MDGPGLGVILRAPLVLVTAADIAPDGDEARRRAEEELAKSIYQEAQATWFDRAAHAVQRFLVDLFSIDANGGTGPIALIVVGVVVVALLVLVLVLAGRPRRAHTSRRGGGDFLGAVDDRSAAQLRADAERAARAAEWDDAIVLRFRALARDLRERDLLDPLPGATAQAIARSAAAVLPGEEDGLHEAASFFDDVRYLRHPATEERYRRLAATEERLRTRQPAVVR